ncbi:MAG: YdcF family protein [Eubacteriales bacterium]
MKTMYNIVSICLIVIAIFSFSYFLVLIQFGGIDVVFGKFWLLLFSISIILLLIISYVKKNDINIHFSIKIIIAISLVIGVISFIWIESLLIKEGRTSDYKSTDYVIVLGARVRGTVPSLSLHQRLLLATEYLKDNSNTLVVVSGGQGPGENITEAEAMETFLIDKGIEDNRIIKEELSTSTYENIKFSINLINEIESGNFTLSIITSDFHVFRAKKIAEKLGVKVQGIGIEVHPKLTINYFVREYFAVVNDYLRGNLN